MAYTTRGRDPLLDAGTQAVLEKRGREASGVLFVLIGLFLALMITTYSAEDATWLVSGDTSVNNWTGRFGAQIASKLLLYFGYSVWALAIASLVWGVRLLMQNGLDRMFNRVMYLPLFLAFAMLYAATLTPSADWMNPFSLGGRLGDEALTVILYIAPGSPGFMANVCSVIFGVATVWSGLFVCGVTVEELQKAFRKCIVWGCMGVAMAAAGWAVVRGTDFKGLTQWREPQSPFDAQADFQSAPAQATAAPTVVRAPVMAAPAPAPMAPAAAPAPMPPVADAQPAAAEPSVRQSMFSRMPSLLKRDPAPVADADVPMTPTLQQTVADAAPDSDDRIRQRITNAINAKYAAPPAAPAPAGRVEPQVTRQGPGPDPMILAAAPLAAAPQAVAQSAAPEAPFAPMPEGPMAHDGPAEPSPFNAMETAASIEAPMISVDDDNLFDDAFDEPQPEAVHTPSPFAQNVPAVPMAAQAAVVPTAPATEAVVPPVAPTAAAAPTPAATVAPEAIAPQPAPAPVAAPAPIAAPVPAVEPAAEAAVEPVHQPLIRPRSPKPTPPSKQAIAEAQPKLKLEPKKAAAYEAPPFSLLMNPDRIERHVLSNEALEENARMLETVLDDYGVKGDIVSVRPGPVVTMYELEPAAGLKASRVIGLADDIARSMSALAARVSTVPGRSVIGIELPNDNREIVALREILSSRDFGDGSQKLPLALGKDIGGQPIVANLAKMPHLLIAGTTGSGKSVAINTMILSLLYKLTPDECRMIMIDPKMLELSVYDGIPHLLSPVVTDPKKAVVALKWVVGEMEDRYRKMSKMGVRNIDGYNSRVKDALAKGELFSRTVQTGFDDATGEPLFETEEFEPEVLPYIVVVVDEMADLMMVAGKEIEACIQRLAQMARASGIHLIMATQRPSVDVITGTIKANFPTRISFQVTSKVDSRTILGEMGAEQLLGMGDMLYMAGGGKITRVHGPFCSDEEVEEVVTHLKAFGPPNYFSGIVDGPDEDKESDIDAVLGLGGNTDGEDALYDTAVQIVIKDRKCSTSYIQRKLAIGYNKAARLVEQMEENGLVSPANHVGKREILVPEQG